jgi:hypothetical protein
MMTADVAYWSEYSPTTQEVAGSIPAKCKQHVCLYWVWVFLSMYLQKNEYKYVFIRYLDSITQAFISAYFGPDSRECKCLEYI